MTAGRRPLVSVVVPVYRHQPYLVPALESILALDYEPLEIVIRDDASPDDAFDVVQRVVGAYRGPHTVKIGRNDRNLSMANFNVLMEEASAEYIVAAHDDDIQYPDRVSRLMDAFLQHGVSMVTSNAVQIDRTGARIGIDQENVEDFRLTAEDMTQLEWPKYYQGATLSWHRDVFDRFGPVDVLGTARTSDFIIPFRAALLNGLYYLKSPTMDRRVHADSRGHIGRNTNDESIFEVERASEHITQWVYVLETCREAVRDQIIDEDRGARLERNIMGSMLDAASKLARNRNMLHMRKKRMAWIGHDAGAVTELDIVSAADADMGAFLRGQSRIHTLEAIRGPRWYKIAMRRPLEVKRWLEVRRLQQRFRS